MMKWIYVVSTINLKEKSKEDIIREYEISKLKFPLWKNKTLEQYYEFIRSWNKDRYSISCEDNAYFVDLEIAKLYVEKNTCDINDGGVYNYAIIKKIPLNTIYACTLLEDVYIYTYNKDTSKYTEVNLDSSEEVKYISSFFKQK